MSIVNRVQNILMKPAAEWEVIASEPATVGGLIKGYAAILFLIPFGITLLWTLLASSMFGAYAGAAIVSVALVRFFVSYLLGLALIVALAHAIVAIAPSFNGKQDLIQSTKLIVYSGTAAWVSSIGLIIPFLGILIALVGIVYSLYLLYLGVRPLLAVPADKVAGFTVVICLTAFVIGIVASIVLNLLMNFMSPVVY